VVLADRQGHRESVMNVGPVCVLARPMRYTLHKRLAGWSQRDFTRWLWLSNPWPCDGLVLDRPRDFRRGAASLVRYTVRNAVA
jgi:hypothetical protein